MKKYIIGEGFYPTNPPRLFAYGIFEAVGRKLVMNVSIEDKAAAERLVNEANQHAELIEAAVAAERKRWIDAMHAAWVPHYMAESVLFGVMKAMVPDQADAFAEQMKAANSTMSKFRAANPPVLVAEESST